jgi:hypothetical protein
MPPFTGLLLSILKFISCSKRESSVPQFVAQGRSTFHCSPPDPAQPSGHGNRLIQPEPGHLTNTGAVQRRKYPGGMLNYCYGTAALVGLCASRQTSRRIAQATKNWSRDARASCTCTTQDVALQRRGSSVRSHRRRLRASISNPPSKNHLQSELNLTRGGGAVRLSQRL